MTTTHSDSSSGEAGGSAALARTLQTMLAVIPAAMLVEIQP